MARPVVAPQLFGVIAEFRSPDALLVAAHATTAAGYRRTEAYSPFPIHGLAEALGAGGTILPWLVLGGGVAGGLGGFVLQTGLTVYAYPLNIGGRPLFSWPSFVPVCFELCVLGAALAAVLGMLALNDLPRPYHPVFAVPRFDLSAGDRFFLIVLAIDPQFEPEAVRTFLANLNPYGVYDVAP